MDPKIWEQPQDARYSLSMKLLTILVGALCLGIAFLAVVPLHAASVSHTSTQVRTSGGGCSDSEFNGVSLKMCIAVKGQNAVSEAFVESLAGGACPNSVSVMLQDKTIVRMPISTSGCGRFEGLPLSLRPNNIYFGHLDVCFGVNCAGQASPSLETSS